MKNKLVSAAVAAALLSVACIPAARAQSSGDLQALKAQLESLQKKVEELEAQQKSQVESQDKVIDQVAQEKAALERRLLARLDEPSTPFTDQDWSDIRTEVRRKLAGKRKGR